MVARHGGERLSESVAHHHIDAYGVDELFDFRVDGGTSRWEEMGVFQTELLAYE